MSCRGNKTVQVKEQSVPATAPSTAATTTTTSSTSATKVKETAVLDKETKPSLMKSSEENKENTSSKNKQKSAGLCGGNRNEVRHDVLTPVPPTLNVGTVGGQKGVENITSPGDTSNSKRADDTHTQKAKVSEVLTKQSSQTDRAVDLKEKQLYDGKKVEERNQVEKAKLVKTKSGKGGSKNVQVQEKKVTSIENKQIVLTNDKITKSSAIKNEQINEKLVEKEMKVSELETEIKDTHQSPSKQSSINFEKIDIDGNPSTSIVSSDQIIENDKIPRKTKGGLCWSSSSVNVKDSVSQKRMSVESQKTNENTVKVNRVNAEKNINTGKETDLKKRKEKQKKVVEEITEFEEDCDSENQLTESLHESLPLSRKAKASTKKKDRKTYVSDEPAARRKSFAFASKKGKYSVSTEKEGDDPLYASIKPSMKANKKKDVTQPAENNQEETDMEEKPGKKIRQDTPQKKRRKKALDTNEELRSVYESQMASLQTKTFSSEEYTLTSQPTVEEEGDLLENAEEERKKNKQRLREKKKSEQGALSHPANLTTNVYESAQREIDKVLGPRLSHDSEGGHEKKQEKKRKKKAKKGKENEAFVPDEPKGETLEEARERMHKLLDDAFSLISHSKSSISNKVQPVDSSDAYSSSTSKHNTPRQDHSVQADLDSSASEEKKHTPINVQRTHEPYDSSGLITWSPYRASDEIATISLPSTQ
ncbi:mucin-17, partial [Biomphalaria glabrata]